MFRVQGFWVSGVGGRRVRIVGLEVVCVEASFWQSPAQTPMSIPKP